MRPIFHWTNSKIRCHILCCMIVNEKGPLMENFDSPTVLEVIEIGNLFNALISVQALQNI